MIRVLCKQYFEDDVTLDIPDTLTALIDVTASSERAQDTPGRSRWVLIATAGAARTGAGGAKDLTEFQHPAFPNTNAAGAILQGSDNVDARVEASEFVSLGPDGPGIPAVADQDYITAGDDITVTYNSPTNTKTRHARTFLGIVWDLPLRSDYPALEETAFISEDPRDIDDTGTAVTTTMPYTELSGWSTWDNPGLLLAILGYQNTAVFNRDSGWKLVAGYNPSGASYGINMYYRLIPNVADAYAATTDFTFSGNFTGSVAWSLNLSAYGITPLGEGSIRHSFGLG